MEKTVVVFTPRLAMDEQKRDADGRFASGSGSSKPGVEEHQDEPKELTWKGSTKFKEGTKVTFKTPSGKTLSGIVRGPAASEGKVLIKTPRGGRYSIHESAVAQDEAPDPYNMQGEAGREARKAARQIVRDCNTGRFRP